QFGALMVVGAGGTLIEVLRDRQMAMAPLDRSRALRLVDRLRLLALLKGHRKGPAVDMEKLADCIARFSVLSASLGDLIEELDVNPLIAGPGGTVAVDALVLPRAAG